MTLRHLFPTLVLEKALLGDASGKRLLGQLKREAYQIADADTDGKAWCRAHYPGGYTSYGSWSRLFEVSSSFAELRKRLDRAAARFARDCRMDLAPGQLEIVSLWVNILKPGGSHSLHLHPLSSLSGTVYLTTPKKGGVFKIEDPRLSKMMAAPPRRAGGTDGSPGGFFKIQPQAGRVILFESWLRHEVEPHFDAGDRVSVSFNYNWF